MISNEIEHDGEKKQFLIETLSDYDNFISNYFTRDIPCSINGMVNHMLIHLFGCVMSERDEIREQNQIPKLFYSRLKVRLDRKEDTGLLPEGTLDIFYQFTDEEQQEIMKELSLAIDSLCEMHNLGKIIVLGTLQERKISFRNKEFSLVIPSVVQSNSGRVIVCPVWTPKSDPENTATADIMGLVKFDQYGREIINTHVWDIRNKKISEFSLDNVNHVKLLEND